MEELTHMDASGRPRMVDVTGKPDTNREAVAKGTVRMQAPTLDLLKKEKMAKGDVLAVAQLAGIMAAKQTPNLIPLCHPVLIGDIKIEFSPNEANIFNLEAAVYCFTHIVDGQGGNCGGGKCLHLHTRFASTLYRGGNIHSVFLLIQAELNLNVSDKNRMAQGY